MDAETQLEEPEILVGAIDKPGHNGTADHELRIKAKVYKGRAYIDARLFKLAKDGSGRAFPTEKGITIRLHEVADVVDAIREASARLSDPAIVRDLVRRERDHRAALVASAKPGESRPDRSRAARRARRAANRGKPALQPSTPAPTQDPRP